jgi:formate C-acetyltransferase
MLKEACRVIRNGSGSPPCSTSDEVVLAQTAMGKSLSDAREGGTSGCIETGCFGKDSLCPARVSECSKILELTLNDGIDPVSGNRVGPSTGDPEVLKLSRISTPLFPPN